MVNATRHISDEKLYLNANFEYPNFSVHFKWYEILHPKFSIPTLKVKSYDSKEKINEKKIAKSGNCQTLTLEN